MTRNPASPARRRVLALAGGAALLSPALLSPLALRPAFAAEYITIATGGTLKIELGTLSGTSPALTYAADSARELNITIANGATIEQVRDAINAAATDGRVSATVITGTAGKQLVLTSGKTGQGNVMKLSGVTGLDFNPAGSGSGAL